MLSAQFLILSAGAQQQDILHHPYPGHPMLPAVKHKNVVIAHRGDHTVLPENTLAAYQSGIASGVDYVEVDLRTSKDGFLVIMHNESVDRMTNGKGNIKDLDYATIRALKIPAGNDASPAAPSGTTAGKTFQIPTFREVLKLCKGKVNIYLDFKEADVTLAYKMIRAAGMEKQIVVYANSLEQLKEWGRVAPSMPVMTSLPDEVNNAEKLSQFLNTYPVAALDGGLDQYSPEMLHLLKQRKVAVWLDVQTKEEGPLRWEKALTLNVEGMQTDHPGALVSWLKEKGVR